MAWVKAADEAFSIEQDYYKAFKYYETALMYRRDTSDIIRLLFLKGGAAQRINAYFEAQKAYQDLERGDSFNGDQTPAGTGK